MIDNQWIMPLMQFGGSMLSQAGPHPQGTGGFGQAFGNALNAGMQGMYQQQQMDERDEDRQIRRLSLMQQLATIQRAQASEAKKEAARTKLLARSDLTDQQKLAIEADPEGAIGQFTAQAFPKQQDPLQVGDKLIDPVTHEVIGDYAEWKDPAYRQYEMQKAAAGRAPPGPEEVVKALDKDGNEIWVPRSRAPGMRVAQDPTKDPTFTEENTLRSQYLAHPTVKAVGELSPIMKSVQASASQDNRASDLDLIYGTAKVLDPIGVVRNEDTITITSAQSPANQVQGYINMMQGKGRLPPASRAELLQLLKNRASGWQSAYDKTASDFEKLATDYGRDPKHIVSRLPPLFPVKEEKRGGGAGSPNAPGIGAPVTSPDEIPRYP